MSTETRPDVDLEELLDNEIPCGGYGVLQGEPVKPCGKPAVLHSRGHGCSPDSPQRFKCISCWQAWYIGMTESARRRGGFNRCGGCKRLFASVADFSDYRPF